MSGRSKSAKLDKLLVVCTEEETRLTAKHGSPVDESRALEARSGSWKGKKKIGRRDFRRRDHGGRSDYGGRLDNRPSSSRDDGRKDYSKVQCYGCRELAYIKNRCPDIKGKQRTTVAEMDEPSTKKLKRRLRSKY